MRRETGKPYGPWIALAAALATGLPGAGCSGDRQVIRLEIRSLPPAVQAAAPDRDRFRFAVTPLGDARPEGSSLGSRRQVWGGKTYFNVDGGELGDIVAQVFVDYLKHERGWRTWLAKPGVAAPEAGPYARLGGKILACEVVARSWLIVTTMTVRTKLQIELTGLDGEAPFDAVIDRTASAWSFGFDRHDVEELVNKVLRATLQEFLGRAKVKGPDAPAPDGA